MVKKNIIFLLLFFSMFCVSVSMKVNDNICDEEYYSENLKINGENKSDNNGFDIIDDNEHNKGDGNTSIYLPFTDE